jgi:hypothetical protein
VDENVGAAAVLGDEAEALFSVEPLDGALCHTGNSSFFSVWDNAPRASQAAALTPLDGREPTEAEKKPVTVADDGHLLDCEELQLQPRRT